MRVCVCVCQSGFLCASFFRCILASLYQGLSVRGSVSWSVCPLAFMQNCQKRRFQPARRILLPAGAYCFLFSFLDASSLLYMRVCPSVRWSVRVSVSIKAKTPKTTISACKTHLIARRGLFILGYVPANYFIDADEIKGRRKTLMNHLW